MVSLKERTKEREREEKERERHADKEGKIYYGKGRKRDRKGERNEAATVTTVVAVFAKLPGSPRYTFKRARGAETGVDGENGRGMQLDVCTARERRWGRRERAGAQEGDYVACVRGELARWRRWRVHGGKPGERG